MNWKLIFQLSFFGLIMAFATVALIPEKIEPVFWGIIFIFCAYTIAKVCNGKYFLNGFLLGILNCVWITFIHFYFYKGYVLGHANTVAMYTGNHPREKMVEFAPVFGVLFGIIIGLLSFVASKIVKKAPPAAV